MRCLIAVILILAIIIAALVVGWIWYGWWGLLGVAVSGFVLLWLATEIGPRILDRVLVETVQITVHSVQFAEEPDAVPEMLRQFDGWIRDFNEESETDGYQIEVDEFLTHNEERLDLARYYVEITVAPPEDKPDAKWSPHSIGLKPLDSDDLTCFELYDVQRWNAESGEYQPFLDHECENVTGELRLRLHVKLDPKMRTYQFDYVFGNPIEVTIDIPVPDWSETPMRRFTQGVLDRLEKHRPLKTLSLNWLDLGDMDLDQIGGITEVEFLAMEQTRITNDGLRRLSPLQNLEALDLDETGIDDDSVEHLAELTSLQRLFIRRTAISKLGIKKLRNAMPTLKIYH